MKFIRRPDLDPQTRIDIVMLAWLHQGGYGPAGASEQRITILNNSLYSSQLYAEKSWHSC
jgi:hypothetical protein